MTSPTLGRRTRSPVSSTTRTRAVVPRSAIPTSSFEGTGDRRIDVPGLIGPETDRYYDLPTTPRPSRSPALSEFKSHGKTTWSTVTYHDVEWGGCLHDGDDGVGAPTRTSKIKGIPMRPRHSRSRSPSTSSNRWRKVRSGMPTRLPTTVQTSSPHDKYFEVHNAQLAIHRPTRWGHLVTTDVKGRPGGQHRRRHASRDLWTAGKPHC